MRAMSVACGGGVVLLSCLAPDVEIVSSLGSGGLGVGGLGVGGFNAGGATSSGGVAGTSNPVTCPPTLPPLGQFPCIQPGLACDYGATHCVCRNDFLECSTSSTGGAGGASNGGGAGSGGTAVGGSAGAPGGNGGASAGGAAGTGGVYVNPCAASGQATQQSGGGYWTTAAWSGYSFPLSAGPGTTVAPSSYAGIPIGWAPCACGTVGADYEAVAGIGVNVNQPIEGGTPMTIAPSGSVLNYRIQGFRPGMRLQLNGALGQTDATQRWCVTLTESSGTFAWSNFRNSCWDEAGGPAYNNEPLLEVLVIVPGDTAAATPFDFCLEQLNSQ